MQGDACFVAVASIFICKNIPCVFDALTDVDYGSGRKFKNGDDRQYGLPLAVFYDNVLDGYGPSYNVAIIYCVICFVFY